MHWPLSNFLNGDYIMMAQHLFNQNFISEHWSEVPDQNTILLWVEGLKHISLLKHHTLIGWDI